MPLWIVATVAAAFFQNLRFMLQKQLRGAGLSSAGATYARFLYSMPLVVLGTLAYARGTGVGWPGAGPDFWAYAVAGGLAQILATVAVVALFSFRNFAVGITLKKTEVLQTALVGYVLLGEAVPPLGIGALVVGLVAVLILSGPPQGGFALLSPATWLGLLSGALFAVAGVAYRGASLALETGAAPFRAAVTLSAVTLLQVLGMTLWFAWRDRAQIVRVLVAWRTAGLVGLTSLAGSYCWFLAFTLQTAAYVYAVGQVELIFSLVASVFFYRETVTRRELIGMALLVVSILGVVLAA